VVSAPLEGVESYLAASAEERLADYLEFLRLPTIGALPEHHEDVLAGASWLAGRLADAGLEHVEVSPTPGRPVVYADWLHAEGAPTVVVYGHYDVQPVDPLEQWVQPPFEPRVADGRVFARGAADDKGQVHLHLWAARAWLATQGRLPVNLRFVIEGEEETGSQHFEAWLLEHRVRLEADLVVVSDTGFYEGNRPALTVSLRGNVHLQVDVTGARTDLHSGSFGGTVQNPAIALARIVSALRDPDGRIAVPGFYDRVQPLSGADRERLAHLRLDDAAYARDIGVPALFGEPGHTTLERRGLRPTLDVCGMWSGFQGEGSKTIIPADAHAKISCRLVADMDPQVTFEQVRDAILAVDVPGVRVSVQLLDTMDPARVSVEHPAARAAADCLEQVFGEAPAFIHEGGSIGAVASFARVLGAPVVLLGFTNPDDNAHAPNESMVLANYEGGARTVARYWEALRASRW
jgi:acetylornithine deacetylase/succinyl-diaminopimelate desuccinylase-like protein